MNLKAKINLTLFFLIATIPLVNGQIYKKFSFEAGANRSININTKRIVSGNSRSVSAVITNESHSFTNNYSFSLGYKIIDNHYIKIRYSKNKTGSLLDGSIRHGGQTPYAMMNTHNVFWNTSWGAMYENQIYLSNGYLPVGFGFERQRNQIYDTMIVVPGILFVNYAFHASVGITYPIFKYTYLGGKAFVTKSFANNNLPIYYAENNGMYVPMQIGIELGLRFSLEE